MNDEKYYKLLDDVIESPWDHPEDDLELWRSQQEWLIENGRKVRNPHYER